jgi:signal transduction histidine kinase/CheY-like chemotaxis protein
VSAAIENANLYEAAQIRAVELEAVHRAGLSLTASLKLHQVLDSILESVMDMVPDVHDSHIFLYNPENGGVLSFGAASWAGGKLTEPWYEPRPEGLTYTIAHTGQTVVVEDISSHPLYANAPSDWSGAIVGIPLKIGERVVGVMNITYKQPRQITPAELRRMRLVGDQAAIAIENARLFESAATERRHLSLLYQVSQEISASLDPDYILERALILACQALSGMMGRAFLYIPNEDRLKLSAMYGWPNVTLQEVDAKLKIRPGRGASGVVFQQRQAVSIPDIDVDPHWLGFTGLDDKTRSAISAPILAGDKTLGVFTLMHQAPGAFSEEHLYLLQAISQQVGLALSNASRYQETNRRLAEITLIHDLAQTFNQRLEVNILLEEVVKTLAREFGYPQVRIFLVEGNELALNACHGPRPCRERFSLSEGIIGKVARTGEAVFLPDVSLDPDYQACFPETRAELTVPIYRGGLVVGVINVETDDPGQLSNQDLELLQVLGVQISIALENAVLFERARQHLAELEGALEHLPVGVLLLDHEHRPLASNPMGRSIMQALSTGSEGAVIRTIGPYRIPELTARHDDPLPVQITLEGRPRRYFEVLARPVGEQLRQWVLTLREVTHEREDQIRTQMQERLATVGQLAAGIAHDFNNIMAAIQVYTDLLHYDLSLNSLSRERLQIIQEQVVRASSLIRQILDFSRRSVMEQSMMNLVPFLKEFSKMLGRVMPENILIELEYSPEAVTVSADPTRLQQVLMNLAVNARDAMPEGGRLRFELAHLNLLPDETASLAILPPGEWVVLTVKDNGMGIPADNLPHIFEPFFTTKSVGEGTGLGLAQVYGIVKQHDGYIDVTSQMGEGTAFLIYLPALNGSLTQESRPVSIERLDGTGIGVLVVEDDPATREALKALLETHHYRVTTAGDGAEAVKIFEEIRASASHPPVSLVVSDLVMPKMGGLALYETLLPGWPEVKMLFITGHPLSEESQGLLEKGKITWLQKPFSVQQFISAVNGLMSED